MTDPLVEVDPASSIWSTDDGAHLREVRAPVLQAELGAVVGRTRAIETGQRAIAAVVVVAAMWRGLTFDSPDDGFVETLVAHGWVLVWLGALGLLVGRSLPARRLVGFLLTGFFLVPILVKLAHGPLTGLVGEDTNWATAAVVPVLEELMKAIPLIALLLGTRRDPSRSLSVLDFGLAGFAVGAGFAIHEDLLWERTLVGGFEGLGGILAPSIVVDPLLVVGHAGWTALVGLGIGFAVVHRGRGPVWLVAVVGASLAVADHAAANFRGDVDVRAWLLDGRLAVIALGLATVAAVISGRAVQVWATKRDGVFPPVPVSRLVAPSAAILRYGDYARQRSMAHTGAWRRSAPGYEAAAQPHVAVVLYEAADRARVSVDADAATGRSEPERGERRRTNPLVMAAVLLVPVAVAAVLWLISGDDDGEAVAARDGSPARTEPDAVADSTDQFGGAGKTRAPTGDGEGFVRSREGEPLTIVMRREDVAGVSTVVAARDGVRQIVRSDDTVLYMDDEGAYQCVAVADGWVCSESAVDPWTLGSLFASFVPDESLEVDNQTMRIEVFDDVIAGRPARCFRQTIGSGSSAEVNEMCADLASMLVLRTKTSGGEGEFASSDVSLEALEVREPRPSDFELPDDLDIGRSVER
jgi:RsiW-degrading membrane proteinase PrsW (M82 family)